MRCGCGACADAGVYVCGPATAVACAPGAHRIVDHARSMRSHAEPCDHLIIPMSHIFWEICLLMGVRAHSAAAAAMCACEYEVER